MIERINNLVDDEKGQVGIGTLIIFIAMVLVAAIAAGVLIDTAGLLESQASDTGDDAQSQVSNHISVISATGNVTGSEVVDIDFTIMKSAGSGDINTSAMTISYLTGQEDATMTFGSAADASTYTLRQTDDTPITDATNNAAVLTDSTDRVIVSLTPGTPLQPGDEATVRFVDQSGGSTIYGVNAPDVISDEAVVEV